MDISCQTSMRCGPSKTGKTQRQSADRDEEWRKKNVINVNPRHPSFPSARTHLSVLHTDFDGVHNHMKLIEIENNNNQIEMEKNVNVIIKMDGRMQTGDRKRRSRKTTSTQLLNIRVYE